jgi:hypothetical protein
LSADYLLLPVPPLALTFPCPAALSCMAQPRVMVSALSQAAAALLKAAS